MASVRERRRSDGTRSSAVLWRDPETGRQTSLTYDDERDAIIAKQLIEAAGGHAIEAARIAEAVRRTGPTVTEAVSDHIDLLTAVGPDARAHYRGQLAAHITPSLGPYPVAAMTYRHIAGWVRMMGEKGLALKTVANVRGLLSVAMTTAVRLGYRADNPCTGVELPKSQATRDERKVLTRAEFGLLLSHIPAFYQPLVLTLAATGLRWGEATALARARPARGRPWSTSTAWAALWKLSGLEADWLDRRSARRLVERLGSLDSDDLVHACRRRAVTRHYRVSNSFIDDLRAAVVRSGTSAMTAVTFGMGEDAARVDGYCDEGALAELVRDFHLVEDARDNAILRVAPLRALPIGDRDEMPAAVVAADLAESVEVRERSAGLRVLEGLLR